MENWGPSLLHALADITEKKQEAIDIDEIKQAMAKHLEGRTVEAIPNSWIEYALRRYGFTEKVHLNGGNRDNIDREKVLLLFNEDLKP